VTLPSTSTSPPAAQDPIYLAFRDRDTVNTWLVLLRSFARPDLRPYSPSIYSPPHPAPYRIWRQLQVVVISGRSFPVGPQPEKVLSDEYNSGPRGGDKDPERGGDKWEGFLEVVVNGTPVGRTSIKSIPATSWHVERIMVLDPDLGGGSWAGSSGVDVDFVGASMGPGWGLSGAPDMNAASLEVRVWRAKSAMFGASSAVHVATTPIDLGPFRRGEAVKSWWPGFPIGGRGEQDGELLLEIKFDE
jgi:hypothetical protein